MEQSKIRFRMVISRCIIAISSFIFLIHCNHFNKKNDIVNETPIIKHDTILFAFELDTSVKKIYDGNTLAFYNCSIKVRNVTSSAQTLKIDVTSIHINSVYYGIWTWASSGYYRLTDTIGSTILLPGEEYLIKGAFHPYSNFCGIDSLIFTYVGNGRQYNYRQKVNANCDKARILKLSTKQILDQYKYPAIKQPIPDPEPRYTPIRRY